MVVVCLNTMEQEDLPALKIRRRMIAHVHQPNAHASFRYEDSGGPTAANDPAADGTGNETSSISSAL
eukprot:CAMPEP_0204187970 /NCGR_PEP_ID=MMETSP0361-20130328/57267_1 /ASSEMBLY_ACC=CAM_ASM_000343 /TAXON_ID=268821 /ORGANISM="Scrippsiella Hangoei, Strain SHTV-5" /LENGTH=66 /DNA_ID=CAMNT_0051148459 /DNA_START=116 /DNA_END=314 /DNA_ORIENTATION=+